MVAMGGGRVKKKRRLSLIQLGSIFTKKSLRNFVQIACAECRPSEGA